MTQNRQSLPPVDPPVVAPPPRFVERRTTFRRAADRNAHEETVLLARSLDVLATDSDAEGKLAGLLELLARTVGARRAAVLSDGQERRVAVHIATEADRDEADALAAWLDAWAPRNRAARAASVAAAVAVVTGGWSGPQTPGRRATRTSAASHHFACLPIPAAGDVVLGFDFAEEAAAAGIEESLPPQLARHAAVALSLVTERVAADRELAQLRARESERTRFVSTVAHELRTPMTGLKGYLELILAGQVAEADQRDFLARSRDIVETMGDLVGDLLELSRLESGALRLEIAPFSVAEVGTRVLAGLAPIAIDRDVVLKPTLPPRLQTALGDRRRVEQILTNLCGNALKFSPPGSTIELSGWFDGQVAVLAVRDEGAGIEAEDRPRIFERFYRMAGHERITGTGLGLPIARDLARAMGGDLEVASVPGSGSAFVLILGGPTGASQEAMTETLWNAVRAEEVRLQERAVLRARPAVPIPPTTPGAVRRPHHDRGGLLVPSGAGGRVLESLVERRPRLRSLATVGPRGVDPTPA